MSPVISSSMLPPPCTTVREPCGFEGIFEVFNMFNTANRSSTNGRLGSPNFGFLNIVNPPRQIQIGVRYTF